MTPTEREALLKLWAEHPETKPPQAITVDVDGDEGDFLLHSMMCIDGKHVAALARDRLVGVLVDGGGIAMTKFVNETYMISQNKDGPILVKDTRLLALIAAYRAMKGQQ